MSRMPINERRKMRLEQVEQCLRSDLTIKEWCLRNHIAESTMYNWIRIFRNDEKTVLPDRSSRRWMEITKDELANMVAIAPPKDRSPIQIQTSKDDGFSDDRTRVSVDIHDDKNYAAPCIRAFVNGIELMLPPGALQQDINRTFRAAASL